MWFSFVHSIKMCLIEYWFPHGHFVDGSSLRMKEWVIWVCPIRSRVRIVSSLLVLLGFNFLSFKIGCIWKSLLWGFSSHNCCHFLVTICLIFGLRSVYGVLMFFIGSHVDCNFSKWVGFIIALNSDMAWNPAEYHLFAMDQWVEFVEDLDNSRIFQFGVFEWLKNWDGVWVDDKVFGVTCS